MPSPHVPPVNSQATPTQIGTGKLTVKGKFDFRSVSSLTYTYIVSYPAAAPTRGDERLVNFDAKPGNGFM